MSAYQAKPSVSSKKFSSKDAAAESGHAGRRRQDLKISFATSEDLGHSKTWRMKTTDGVSGDDPNLEEQSEDDYENEPIVSHSIQHVWLEHPIPDKLFFLATGEGCGTAQVCIMQMKIISFVPPMIHFTFYMK